MDVQSSLFVMAVIGAISLIPVYHEIYFAIKSRQEKRKGRDEYR